ncbi:hypothetical protein C2845_PM04G00600 [Panicum miliaceum]|uniref:Subtilisin-like protease SBT1.7 n=1 Tax=Panicum miliaceum TaxID=4540 RepID=A0A3L6QQA4_PANMI|nr:hypothetical protein C2845_PM04G00600 [Panicum miliaceum]
MRWWRHPGGMPPPSLLAVVILMATASAAAAESLPSTAPPPPGDQADASETYIVSMANQLRPLDFTDNTEWYSTKLRSVAPSAGILYSYQTIVQGFAARMTPAQAEKLESKPGVLVVSPERRYVLHTTRTPEYLGLDRVNGLLAQASGGSDVIIGLVNSGVWPESRSFDDAGYGPVPARWRGRCEEGRNFTRSACNNKLIGARSFAASYQSSANKGAGPDWTKEARSPRDVVGHGTHTASTATGSAVPGAGLGRMAAGTARGMAPRARVAAYKACWAGGCYSADILAAMEAAVADGVDVLSVSAGVDGGDLAAYFKDGMAAGAYSAMEKGVFVACSAGNKGPGIGTLANGAPWLTTVGAGTIDREFPAYFILGDGRNLTGVSLYGRDEEEEEADQGDGHPGGAEAGDENGDPAEGKADPDGADVDENLVHGQGRRGRQEHVRVHQHRLEQRHVDPPHHDGRQPPRDAGLLLPQAVAYSQRGGEGEAWEVDGHDPQYSADCHRRVGVRRHFPHRRRRRR